MASTTRAACLLSRSLRTPARRLLTPQISSSILSQSRSHFRQPSTLRAAAFSTSSQRNILPPEPQVIKGGVNDPAPVPEPHPTHGSYHWIAERAIAVGLVPLTLAPFAGGAVNPTIDAIFVAALLVHTHVGFQAVIIDYIPEHRMPTIRKLFDWGLVLATVAVGVGLYEFETNDVGLSEGIRRLWHAGANDATVGKADLSGLGHDGKLKHLTQ